MRDPGEQLNRIQNAMTKIAGYVQKGRQAFDAAEDFQLSIIYYLQTISEAARAIPQEFQKRHPEIPWKQFIDFQNYIIHYYREIDRDALWGIACNTLPLFESSIDAVLAEVAKPSNRSSATTSSNKERTTAQLERLLKDKRDDILSIAKQYGVSNVRIFGSIARGEADTESDIDLLVDVAPGRTLFDLNEFLVDLQGLLGHDVDVLTEKGLNNRMRERVMKEAIPL